MHRLVMILVVSVVVCGVVWAQGSAGLNHRHMSGQQGDLSGGAYTVQLVEFRLNTEPGHVLTPEEIMRRYQRLRSAGTLDVAGVMSATCVASKRTMIERFEEKTHRVFPFDDKTSELSNIESVISGGSADFTLSELDDGKHLSIQYESALWNDPENPDDTPDHRIRLRVSTTIPITLGQPALIGGTDAAGGRYVVVTVTE